MVCGLGECWDVLVEDSKLEQYFRISSLWTFINSVLYLASFILSLACDSTEGKIMVFVSTIAVIMVLHFMIFSRILRSSGYAYANPDAAIMRTMLAD